MNNPFRRSNWKQTEATVYTCGVQSNYEPGLGASGIDSKYLIVFSYEVDGERYSGEYTSSSPVAEKSSFSLRYDADNPEHNQYSLRDAMNSLPFKIAAYAALIGAVVLYEWFRDHAHH